MQNAQIFIKICEILYQKVCEIPICQNVNTTKNTATLQILQKIWWSPLYFNRETFMQTLASFYIPGLMKFYIPEKWYIPDLWDKIKEVTFSQLFPCVLELELARKIEIRIRIKLELEKIDLKLNDN
jgi:hypothetical protein